MGTVISNLKAKFGVDTTDFKKGLKDGEKATADFKDAAGGQIDKFAEMFGVNMSAVSDAVGTATKALNGIGQGFKAARDGGDKMVIGLKFLKMALVSTGLGAIVVVLGSVMAYFSKSGEGADKFAKILAQLKSVLNNVVERLVAFGKGVVDFVSGKFAKGVQEMGSAFKGMGDEIKADWKATGVLADALDALEDREIALIGIQEERKRKINELRYLAKEEKADQKKKLDLLLEAEKITKQMYADDIDVAKQKAALRAKELSQGAVDQSTEAIANETKEITLLKEKLDLKGKDITDEQLKEVATLLATVNTLYADQANELKGISREKKTALAIVTEEIALEKAKANQVAITHATISNLKIPDFGQLMSDALAPMPKIQQAVHQVSMDLSKALEDAFSAIAEGMGEFLGSLIIGDASFKDFGKMVAATFADLAITVGKIAIGAGIAVLGIKTALETLNPYVAIAAGIALVALGTAVRGSLKSAASAGGGGGGGSTGSSSGGSLMYDTRTPVQPQHLVQVQVTGELVAHGSVLKAIIKNEDNRLKAST